MKNKFYKICTLSVLIMLGNAGIAQNIVQLSFYSPLISTFEMKYINDHLVVSQDGLLIFDVTNPNVRPKLVAQKEYPGDIAKQLAVQGNFAYMSHGNNGIFAVYNISIFSSPVLIGSTAIPSTSYSWSGDLEPNGNFVYLAGFDSIFTINVSNPFNPQVVNAIEGTHTQFTGLGEMVIDGSTLFIRTPFGVDGYDISDPATPRYFGSMKPLHPYSQGLEIDTASHRLFSPWVSDLKEFTGHDAYDVSNPHSPKYLFSDSVQMGSGDYGVTGYSYNDTVLYISGSSVNAFDVKPATHHFVTNFSGADVANSIVSIEVKDSVFFNARGGGIEVLKYTNILPPVCNAPLHTRNPVIGTTAYLAWKDVANAKGYIVRYRKVNRGWNYDSSINNVHVLKNLEPRTLYYWEVASVCGVKPTFRSDFSLTGRFNTHSESSGNAITIAPNPVHDVFRIKVSDASVKHIIITNFTGNTVMQLTNVKNGEQISFSRMPSGTYMVQALNTERKIIDKTTLFKE